MKTVKAPKTGPSTRSPETTEDQARLRTALAEAAAKVADLKSALAEAQAERDSIRRRLVRMGA